MHVKQAGVVPEHINISKYVDACRPGRPARLRSGSFRPGPAAHKPSREGINRLQSVGSPHVTDEEGFPAVAGTASAGSCRSPPQRPGSPAAQPKPPQGAAPGSGLCFCIRGPVPVPSRPDRAGSGKHGNHEHTSSILTRKTPEFSSFFRIDITTCKGFGKTAAIAC